MQTTIRTLPYGRFQLKQPIPVTVKRFSDWTYVRGEKPGTYKRVRQWRHKAQTPVETHPMLNFGRGTTPMAARNDLRDILAFQLDNWHRISKKRRSPFRDAARKLLKAWKPYVREAA